MIIIMTIMILIVLSCLRPGNTGLASNPEYCFWKLMEDHSKWKRLGMLSYMDPDKQQGKEMD